MKKHVSEVDSYLRSQGLRRTPVRAGVIEVLTASDRPMSVPDILGKLRGVDSVTVYRTLNTFVSKKIVHRVRGDDRSWLYAIGTADSSTPHKHPHFVCEGCGKVECLEKATIPADFLSTLHVGREYRVHYSEVVLHGCCPKCK